MAANTRDIRRRIKSVKNTSQITKAMQMVAAAKMRKAQQAALGGRPYAELLSRTLTAVSAGASDGAHELMKVREVKKELVIVVSTDKGLCGGLNTNLLRQVTTVLRETQTAGKTTQAVAIGGKGLGFLNRVGAKVISHVTHLGDRPHLDKLIGPVKVLLDAYARGEVSAVYLCYNKFVSTMKQDPVVEQLLPLSAAKMQAESKADGGGHAWDYLYEPDAQTVIDDLLVRYVEALVFQALAENMASEHAARMVAMKAATDNAGSVIAELKLVYNKTRQAAITKELSEIVSGAAAISG